MDLTYDHIYDSIDNIWSVLLTTGYLTQRGNLDGKRYQLAIPNMEIRNIFTEQIMSMFKENTKRDGEKYAEDAKLSAECEKNRCIPIREGLATAPPQSLLD